MYIKIYIIQNLFIYLFIYPCFHMSDCSGYNRKARVHSSYEKGS